MTKDEFLALKVGDKVFYLDGGEVKHTKEIVAAPHYAGMGLTVALFLVPEETIHPPFTIGGKPADFIEMSEARAWQKERVES
jgi:hypothetical protein